MKIRRKRIAIAVAVLALVGLPGLAAAAPFDSTTVYQPISFERFCTDSQGVMANLDQSVMTAKGITLHGTFYSDFDSFVGSKSSVDPTAKTITTVEYVTYTDAAKSEPMQIRCKYRSGESFDKGAWPNDAGYFGFGPTVGAGVSSDPANDATCAQINQRTIDAVLPTLSSTVQASWAGKIVTDPDHTTETGSEWTAPWPTLTMSGDVLHVPSQTLYAPTTAVAPYTGVPANFGGAHYCTLVAPQYLRDVLLGAPVVG